MGHRDARGNLLAEVATRQLASFAKLDESTAHANHLDAPIHCRGRQHDAGHDGRRFLSAAAPKLERMIVGHENCKKAEYRELISTLSDAKQVAFRRPV